MSNPYENMKDEDFDRILLSMMEEDGMATVLYIPGVYEAVSEHYHNYVLDCWLEEQEELEDEKELPFATGKVGDTKVTFYHNYAEALDWMDKQRETDLEVQDDLEDCDSI